jgi:hypothetical protein
VTARHDDGSFLFDLQAGRGGGARQLIELDLVAAQGAIDALKGMELID